MRKMGELMLSKGPGPSAGQLRCLVRALWLLVVSAAVLAGVSAQAQNAPQRRPTVDPVVARQMHDAIAAAEHGDEPRALTLVDTLVEQHPTFAPGLKLKAMLLENMGRASESAEAYEAALKLTPNDAELLLKIGIIDLLRGRTDQAVALLERRVHAVPGDEQGNYYLAQAYHLQGNNDAALQAIRDAVKAAPNSPQLWQKYGELLCSSGENEEALRWLKKAQGADVSLPRIDFDLAVASFQSMDLKSAEDYASHEVLLHGNDLDNRALLASVQIKLGDWTDARGNLQQVLAVRTQDARSVMELGHCELELKQDQAAVDDLNRALQLDPTLLLAHFYLSRAYAALGQTEQAQHEAALHREMLQHSNFSLPKAEAKREQATLDQVQTLLAAGHEREALHLLQQGEGAQAASQGSAWVGLGASYLALSKPDQAERSFHQALTLDPKTRNAHTYLGYMQLQQGNLGPAETEFQAELAIDPNNTSALGELGEVRYRQGRWNDAADLLVRSKTTSPLLLYLLCDAYFRLGKPQKAELTAESLAAYGHGETAILQALGDLLRRNGETALADRLVHPS